MFKVFNNASSHSSFVEMNIKEASSLKYSSGVYRSNPLKLPLRVIRLMLLGVLLPSILVALPLYMRYHALREQAYPFAQSDIRLLDGRISTAWCQTQTVRANGTFNAFLMPGRPETDVHRQRITMVRDMTLTDDMKEYWGFYLLRGSAVTVSTCSRWPGASLIVIRGHQHLLECAYIGDESSEELNEVRRIQIRQQLEYRHSVHVGAATPRVIAKPAIPAEHADQQTSYTSTTAPPLPSRPQRLRADNPPNDPEKMRKVKEDGVYLHQEAPPANTYFALDESSQERDDQLLSDNSTEREIYERRADAAETAMNAITSSLFSAVFGRRNSAQFPTTEPPESSSVAEAEEGSSSEVLADVLRRLQHLGSRGSRVLKRLGEQAALETATTTPAPAAIAEPITPQPVSSDELDVISVENATKGNLQDAAAREKRHVDRAELHQQLTQHDIDMDAAVEEQDDERESLLPNGDAISESTPSKDGSHSEFWSSFSSSEEALLRCPGLVLNLPLSPHRSCQQRRPLSDLHNAAAANKVTYRVPADGYYFFVFNSENEAQENFVRVQFEMDKATYNVSRPVAYCKNSTEPCSLPLSFMSSETVVLELPVGNNDSLWNQHFVVYSTCEPRTAIYLICLVAVPFVILFFAFQ